MTRILFVKTVIEFLSVLIHNRSMFFVSQRLIKAYLDYMLVNIVFFNLPHLSYSRGGEKWIKGDSGLLCKL